LSLFDKEMKSRHGQWLIVIKKSAGTEPAKTQKAATGHQPQPLPATAQTLISESEKNEASPSAAANTNKKNRQHRTRKNPKNGTSP